MAELSLGGGGAEWLSSNSNSTSTASSSSMMGSMMMAAAAAAAATHQDGTTKSSGSSSSPPPPHNARSHSHSHSHSQSQHSSASPGVLPSAALNSAIDAAGASGPSSSSNATTGASRLQQHQQSQQKHLLLSPHVGGGGGVASAAGHPSSPGGGGPSAYATAASGGINNKNSSSNTSSSSSSTSPSDRQQQGGADLAAISAAAASSASGGPPAGINENEKVYWLIVELLNPSTREAALLELSKKREQWDDLALVLWHSFGVMSALLQEIVSVYPLLSPASLTAGASNRVCNALALLQCVASHNDTRGLFLQAHIPLFLYPFLNTTSKTRPFEYLRLTSLGVIGALVKQNDNSDVINFLLSTEIIPLCLRIMETGSELSKTVAIFIVQKILLDEMGLAYICQTYERFYAVGTVLSNMVQQLVETQAVRLLKHVVRCYLRLSDNLRAREALRACLPEELRNATFSHLLKGDLVTKRCLASLLLALSDRVDG